MKCEMCRKEHNGQYGSGRFCSKSCASVFSTKNKRKEINEKVSKILTGRGHDDVDKICPCCNKNFKVIWKRRYRIYCSLSCSSKYKFTDEMKEKMSLWRSKYNSEGNFKFNSIRNIFLFKNKEIRCDSLKERDSLNGLIKIYIDDIVDIDRSNIFIKYNYNNKNKYFNPDFIITLKNNKKILMECKTKISKNNTNKQCRPLYFLTIENKKESMFKYCQDNNMIYCWYDGRYDFKL